MFKFLRKYNKWILAVGGTLLMIVFLVPQAISSLSQRAAQGSAVWATVGPNDEEVSAEIRRQCENELRALENIQRQGGGPSSTDRADHWYLLLREAEQAGFTGALGSDQLSAEQMQAISTVIGQSSLADRALGNRMAIDQLVSMYLRAPKMSDTRIRRQAERMFHSVDARFVILEASDTDDVPAPTGEQIAAQFDEFRDVVPRADGAPAGPLGAPTAAPEEEDLGFGYRLPDRFKLEWLRIEADDVEAMVEAGSELNEVALYKHWQLNVTAKGFPPFPAEGEEVPPVPDVVRTDLLRELTMEKLGEVERFITDRLFATWRRLRIQDGYRELPEDWETQRCDFEALAREVQGEFKGLALPTYRAERDRWLRSEDLAELEGLENTFTDRYTNATGLAALIAAAKEFGGDTVILTQMGVADPPLRDRDDESLVFFRILEVDPSRPPHDVDEVRDEVVRDLKRKTDYQRLLEARDSIESNARAQGLLAVAMANDLAVEPITQVHIDSPSLLTFQLQNNFSLQRMSSLPGLGAHATTVERIIDRSMGLPRDKDVRELPVEDRVFVLEVDDRMTLLVVEILKQEALSNDGFKQIAGLGLDRVILGEELASIEPPIDEVFGYDALAKRHNFQIKRREEADAQPDASGDGADADPPVADAGSGSDDG